MSTQNALNVFPSNTLDSFRSLARLAAESRRILPLRDRGETLGVSAFMQFAHAEMKNSAKMVTYTESRSGIAEFRVNTEILALEANDLPMINSCINVIRMFKYSLIIIEPSAIPSPKLFHTLHKLLERAERMNVNFGVLVYKSPEGRQLFRECLPPANLYLNEFEIPNPLVHDYISKCASCFPATSHWANQTRDNNKILTQIYDHVAGNLGQLICVEHLIQHSSSLTLGTLLQSLPPLSKFAFL